MKHVWIVKKDSSTMLFYYSYNNKPFKAILVSGLLSAMNSFSEIEIQKRGIQSIDMYDLRWVYLNDPKHNLLLIGADDRESNANVMQARLAVINSIFIDHYNINPKFWDKSAIDLDMFLDFGPVLEELSLEWQIADKSMDLGLILDLLRVFQNIILILCDFIKSNIKGSNYRKLLYDLHQNSPRLRERYGNYINFKAFEVLELFLPKIDMVTEQIVFHPSEGQNILQSNPKIGLEHSMVKAIFYMIIRQFVKSIWEVSSSLNDKLVWYTFLQDHIMPYFIKQWDYLASLGILQELISIFFTKRQE